MQVNKHCVALHIGGVHVLLWAQFPLEEYEARSMLTLDNYKEHYVRLFPCTSLDEAVELAKVLS